MSSYSSKSQKRSKSQSKNGGRRRKRTLKNVRRRKSRKVMMGGDDPIAGKINGLSAETKSNVLALLGVKNPYAVTREQLKLLSDDVKTQLKTLGFDVAFFPE